MYKVMWLMTRKADITHEQFRDHYENSHVILGQKYYGHLFHEYRRNYPAQTLGGSPAPGGGFGPREPAYDCITEMIFHDEAAYQELLTIASDPAIGKIFLDDEKLFMDSSKLIGIMTEVVNTGPGDGAEGVAFMKQAAA